MVLPRVGWTLLHELERKTIPSEQDRVRMVMFNWGSLFVGDSSFLKLEKYISKTVFQKGIPLSS